MNLSNRILIVDFAMMLSLDVFKDRRVRLAHDDRELVHYYLKPYSIIEPKPKKLDRPYQPDYEKHRPSVSNKKPFGLK